MNSADSANWEERLLSASISDLRRSLERRLVDPDIEGPPLDERTNEGSEEIFIRLAAENPVFEDHLALTVANYFRDGSADRLTSEAILVTRGLLEIVQRRGLSGAFTAIKSWLLRSRTAIEHKHETLGRAALGALATSQARGVAANRDFWLVIWRDAPLSWKPRIFIGLRLQDPSAACELIPELLTTAAMSRPPRDPIPLLRGLWEQVDGKAALLSWLRSSGRCEAADTIRQILPEVGRGLQGERRPRRKLPSVACCGSPWLEAA